MESIEKELYTGIISEQELLTLEYLSKTILTGVRPYELEILKQFLDHDILYTEQIEQEILEKYGYEMKLPAIEDAMHVLQGQFVSNDKEGQKYSHIDIVEYNQERTLRRMNGFTERLKHSEFRRQVNDIIEVGLRRYRDKYSTGKTRDDFFILHEKYSRRDICFLMNCRKDMSSTMYGMKRIGEDVFIFVIYHKEKNLDSSKKYVDGKPDYEDVFEDNMTFRWDSQMGKGIHSSYVKEVVTAQRKHLLVKKRDAEISFYYMGQFDILHMEPAKKIDQNGKERDIAKFRIKMRHAVRDDLLRYLQSGIENEEERKS